MLVYAFTFDDLTYDACFCICVVASEIPLFAVFLEYKLKCSYPTLKIEGAKLTSLVKSAKDEINVPIALSAFRDNCQVRIDRQILDVLRHVNREGL